MAMQASTALPKKKGANMQDQVYKNIELTGTSGKSLEDAINNAIEKASKTVRKMRWFEVTEIRGAIRENKVNQFQVSLKVGFSLEE